jgi:hypothetical protein
LKFKKLIVFLVIAQCCNLKVLGQGKFLKHTEIGLLLGAIHYAGDLNQKFNIPRNVGPGASLIVQRNSANTRWGWRNTFSAGRFSAADKFSNDAFLQNRNLSVRTFVAEVSSQLVFNFLPYEIGGKTPGMSFPFTPYIFTGGALYYFSPKAELNGTYYKLRFMDTEGQGTSVYQRKRAAAVQFAIPLGIGFKASVNKKMGIGIEWGLRKLYTDYLDDVSMSYVYPPVLIRERGPEAAALSDRSLNLEFDENENYSNLYRQRGNSNTKDWYSFVGISFVWRIDDNRGRCPSY